MRAAIVAIGDELLSGHTQDTNSNYIAKRLFRIGVDLVEVRQVGDEAVAIQGAIWELQERRGADVVITTGGVGPTHDDRTVSALAALHGVSVSLHQPTWEWLLERRERLVAEGRTNVPTLNDASRKMALVPVGAKVFQNTLGAAPGLALTRRLTTRAGTGTTLSSAGVPEEVRNLWVRHFEPWLVEQAGDVQGRTVHEIVYYGYESEMAQTLERIEAEHPGVSIGSYPQWGKKRVVLRAAAADPRVAGNAAEALVSALQAAGHAADHVAPEDVPSDEREGSGPNA